MNKVLKNSWALFLGMGFLMMAYGFQGSLLGVRAVQEEFSLTATGFMMSGYFVGYFIGASTIPNVISRVGHIRVFAAFASLASLVILIHSIFINPFIWFLLRVLTGISMVCIYTVAESWLNDRSSNKNRGSVLSIYMVILYGSMGVGMFLLNFSSPQNFQPFILISVITSVALIPILLTSILRLIFFWRIGKINYQFQFNVIPSKFQLKLLATNISDWTFANAFRISLVSTLPLLELGLVDRAFAFLKVPTNLVQETAQRVMYNKIGTKNSIKYIFVNAILIILGSCSVIYFGYILGFWEGEWTELTKYMLLVIPYVIVETIANLLIPFLEMTKNLVNTKTFFNFSASLIILVCIISNVNFLFLLTIVTILELFRLVVYFYLLKKHN